jgi:hypothetical protein
MKMTMHIDEELLKRVMEGTGAASKTEAVRLALSEMDRKMKLAYFHKNGLGLTKEDFEGNEWHDETALDKEIARNRLFPSLYLNETPPEERR